MQLGSNALWDDEALTALIGKGILEGGTTSVVVDHNIVAFRSGLLIKDMADRSTPPLCEYVTAPFLALFPDSAFWARAPFALFGLASIFLMIIWIHRIRLPQTTQWLLAIVLLTNVSLFLYFRQCRYYAPAIFFTLLILYFYLRKSVTTKSAFVIAFASILLFASNYLSCIALYVCLTVDYLLWRRKEITLTKSAWLALIVPQAIGCLAIALYWNPLYTNYASYLEHSSFLDRVTLFFWSWRDMNHCEFFSGVVLALSLAAGLYLRDSWLIRGSVFCLAYTAFICVVSPQILSTSPVADVRYLVPLIPIFLALQVRFLSFIAKWHVSAAFALAILAFSSNLFNGGPLLVRGWTSTVFDFGTELLAKSEEPFTPAAEWIRENLSHGESIYVAPDYMTYPLMFHASNAIYAWQFGSEPAKEFRHLDPIHFKFREAPDYMIAFGPSLGKLANEMRLWQEPVKYVLIKRLDHLGIPLYRPELFWRTFKPIKNFDLNSQAIYIFKKTGLPPDQMPASEAAE